MSDLYVRCGTYHCPVCGDSLIHQTKRKNNESSSGYGQYIHDKYGNTFYFMDVDCVIYKKATRIMRLIEHKPKEQRGLKDSQRHLLPMLAKFIKMHVDIRFLAEQSGVFCVRESETGYGGACEIEKFSDIGIVGHRAFTSIERKAFETGLKIPQQQWEELCGETHASSDMV